MLIAFNGNMKNTYQQHKEQLTATQKFAIKLTNKVGTIGFFFIIFTWTLLWLGWNMFAPPHLQFDPYPAFVFWLFISNMIQIFLMPLIMVGQNLQSKHAELRAENDYRVNIKAEAEIAALHKKMDVLLDEINKLKTKS